MIAQDSHEISVVLTVLYFLFSWPLHYRTSYAFVNSELIFSFFCLKIVYILNCRTKQRVYFAHDESRQVGGPCEHAGGGFSAAGADGRERAAAVADKCAGPVPPRTHKRTPGTEAKVL